MSTVGRPRSEAGHKAILRAAYDLLDEGGFSRLSFDRVAARAGVSRSTIYRWWPSKGALAMESALGALAVDLDFTPGPSPIENVRTRLRLVARTLTGRSGRLIAGMLVEAQHDFESMELFTRNFVEPGRKILRDWIEQAIDGGMVDRDFDLDMAIDIAFGASLHQLLLRRPLGEDWVDRLVEFMFRRPSRPAP